MRKISKILNALGIKYYFKDDTKMSKADFIKKLHKSRNGKMVNVKKEEQAKLLG